jgi:hypothetical protein
MAHTKAPEISSLKSSNFLQADLPGDISYQKSLEELGWYKFFAESSDVLEFARRIRNGVERLGFSDFSYHRVECKSSADVCMYTTPKRLAEYYDGEGAWQYDPVLLHCATKDQPIFRSTVNHYIEHAPFANEAFARILKLRDYTSGLGFFDYYHRSLRTTNGNGNAVLSITARNMRISEFHSKIAKQVEELSLLARVIDYVGSLKFPQHFMDTSESRDVVISPRPLVLLHVLAKSDLTVSQAADQLSISISSVNKHVAALKQAFGAKTLWGALYKATKAGLIN